MKNKEKEILDELSSELTHHTIVAYATEEEVLKSLGLRNFDCTVVAIRDDIQASILPEIVLEDLRITMNDLDPRAKYGCIIEELEREVIS